MARTPPSHPREDFYQDLDRARLSSGWSCSLVVAILVIIYALGVWLLTLII